MMLKTTQNSEIDDHRKSWLPFHQRLLLPISTIVMMAFIIQLMPILVMRMIMTTTMMIMMILPPCTLGK